jgi:hypothetical protein
VTGIRSDAPPPPREGSPWPERLRWIVCAVDVDHPDLPFAASLLAQSIERAGGLSDRQLKYAHRLFDRLSLEWHELSGTGAAGTDLAHLPTAGSA